MIAVPHSQVLTLGGRIKTSTVVALHCSQGLSCGRNTLPEYISPEITLVHDGSGEQVHFSLGPLCYSAICSHTLNYKTIFELTNYGALRLNNVDDPVPYPSWIANPLIGMTEFLLASICKVSFNLHMDGEHYTVVTCVLKLQKSSLTLRDGPHRGNKSFPIGPFFEVRDNLARL